MKPDRVVLFRGLDQLGTVLGEVTRDRLDAPTPCSDWTVRDLVDHVVQSPANFARMVRGVDVDWSRPTPRPDDWVAAYREHADDLRAAWHEAGDSEPPAGAAWQCAEIAVHTYDLVTAMGRPTDRLDPEVAERGLTFMRAALTADNRAPAFGPEHPAPAGANAYERIAAFAGRDV
jgi:uncharacterized protein (TIGR03086 family)